MTEEEQLRAELVDARAKIRELENTIAARQTLVRVHVEHSIERYEQRQAEEDARMPWVEMWVDPEPRYVLTVVAENRGKTTEVVKGLGFFSVDHNASWHGRTGLQQLPPEARVELRTYAHTLPFDPKAGVVGFVELVSQRDPVLSPLENLVKELAAEASWATD